METIKARTDFDSTLFGEGSTISAAISDLAEKIEARVRAIDTSSSFEALDLLIENLHGRGVWIPNEDRWNTWMDLDGKVQVLPTGAHRSSAPLCGEVVDLAFMGPETRAGLRGADLRGAIIIGAMISSRGPDYLGTDLSGADLRGAVFEGGLTPTLRLDGADLRCADLVGPASSLVPSSALLAQVAPGAKLAGARREIVNIMKPHAGQVMVTYEGTPNGGYLKWEPGIVEGGFRAPVGSRPYPDDDCACFGTRFARWAGIEMGENRGTWRRSRLQGPATPAQLAALVEGQRTFERLASERAVQIPRSGQFRQGPFMGMRQILKLVCSSIGGTLERLGCEPGPVNEDLDFE